MSSSIPVYVDQRDEPWIKQLEIVQMFGRIKDYDVLEQV